MPGVSQLLHGACAVIIIAMAFGIYRQKPDIRRAEAFLARQPLFPQAMYAMLLLILLGGSLDLVAGTLAAPSYFVDIICFLIHEGGHFLTSWAGRFAHAAGGTLFEIGVPAGLTYWALSRDCKRLAAFPLAAMSIALFSVAAYSGDALTLELDLFGSSNSIEDKMASHDWYVMLSRLGALEAAPVISDLVWSMALVAGVAPFALLAWAWYLDRRPQDVFYQKLS